MTCGVGEGRNPTPWYDEAHYLAQKPDVAALVAAGTFQSGIEHFVLIGTDESRDPSALFDESAFTAMITLPARFRKKRRVDSL